MDYTQAYFSFCRSAEEEPEYSRSGVELCIQGNRTMDDNKQVETE